jgi:hypothetical protein
MFHDVEIFFGPSRVRALPLGVAAEQSVQYCDFFFFSFCPTYFSPRRGCAIILKFGTEL